MSFLEAVYDDRKNQKKEETFLTYLNKIKYIFTFPN